MRLSIKVFLVFSTMLFSPPVFALSEMPSVSVEHASHFYDNLLVEYFHPGCSHCKRMSSSVEAVEKFYPQVSMFKALADGVFDECPTTVLYCHGKQTMKIVGDINTTDLGSALSEAGINYRPTTGDKSDVEK